MWFRFHSLKKGVGGGDKLYTCVPFCVFNAYHRIAERIIWATNKIQFPPLLLPTPQNWSFEAFKWVPDLLMFLLFLWMTCPISCEPKSYFKRPAQKKSFSKFPYSNSVKRKFMLFPILGPQYFLCHAVTAFIMLYNKLLTSCFSS